MEFDEAVSRHTEGYSCRGYVGPPVPTVSVWLKGGCVVEGCGLPVQVRWMKMLSVTVSVTWSSSLTSWHSCPRDDSSTLSWLHPTSW